MDVIHFTHRATLRVVNAATLTAHARGISTPERIDGQTWPTDAVIPH